MAISDKLFKFKFHLSFLIAFSLLMVFSHIFLLPNFIDVLTYFWPLFVSTALFLVSVVLFGRTLPPDTEPPGVKAGEGLLDYVAGKPEEEGGGEEEEQSAEERFKSEQVM
ncbi:hypothetical protein U1Q18_023995 [Sarracenia purpurea var. burkii]